jgi:hypothetical protein
MRSGYREWVSSYFPLRITTISSPSILPWWKRRGTRGEKDHIKLLLAEAIGQQRNEMLENFSQILQQLSTITGTSSSSSLFGDTTIFKVQVNFDIPIFEG